MGWPVTKCAVAKIVTRMVKSPYFYVGSGMVAVTGTMKYMHETDKDVIRMRECDAGLKEC